MGDIGPKIENIKVIARKSKLYEANFKAQRITIVGV
jgi:hypothetical protein